MFGIFGVHLSIRRAEKKETEKYSRPYRAKKSASTSLLPNKKNIWRRRGPLKSQHRLGRPRETRRPGVRLWRPGGYLHFTLGLPWANVRLTLG